MKFKKPKFWDLKKPNFFSYVLFPFTILVRINNFFLNNKRLFKSHQVKSLCVGNIYVGGTGKTPTVIKIYELLNSFNYNVATAKKFYLSQKDEQTILNNKTKLIIGKTRKKIIEKAEHNEIKLVIFDDGLQDKDLDYDLKAVCFDSEKWIGNGHLLPSGPLREKLDSLKKYNIVFLKQNYSKLDEIIKIIKYYNPSIQIFITEYKFKNLSKFNTSDSYLIFSGIGNHDNFKDSIAKENFKIVDEIIFPDHYEYTDNEINSIISKAEKLNAKILTTEKDFVKIPKDYKKKINFIEIDLKIQDEDKLINFLKHKLNEKH